MACHTGSARRFCRRHLLPWCVCIVAYALLASHAPCRAQNTTTAANATTTTTTTTTTTSEAATSTAASTGPSTPGRPPLSTVDQNTTSTTTTTTTTTTAATTATSEPCVDRDPTLCSFIASEGHCRDEAFQGLRDLCCATCSNLTVVGPELTWYACGFGGDVPSTACFTRGVETCFPITTGPRGCAAIPEEFGLGLRYLSLELDSSIKEPLPAFGYGVHRDDRCETSYSLDSSLSGSTQLGSCTPVRAGSVTVFHLTIFSNCTERNGTWTCFGTDLPCFHWTRQSEAGCTLPGDDFECEWNPETGCGLAGTVPSCGSETPPSCGPSRCKYDAYLRLCVSADLCDCTSDGRSGNTTVPFTECTTSHPEPGFESKAICYLNGGLNAVGACGCATKSSVFPGASFRTCIPEDNCNVLFLESQGYPFVNGTYIASEQSTSSLGCVPVRTFSSAGFGFGDTKFLLTPQPEYGREPENVPWRNVADTWLLLELTEIAAVLRDIVLSGFIASDSVPLIREVETKDASGLTGIWDVTTGTGLRSPVFVKHTCSRLFPCSRPHLTVFSPDVNDTVSVAEKLQILDNIPGPASRARELLFSGIATFLDRFVSVVTALDVRASFFGAQAAIANDTFIPTVSTITCTGVLRADPTIALADVTGVMDMSTFEQRSGLLSLTFEAYAVYQCHVRSTGPFCLPTSHLDSMFITPARLPASRVDGLAVDDLTPVCATVKWNAPALVDVRGILRGYDIALASTNMTMQLTSTQPDIHICGLEVGTLHNATVRVRNHVGMGPAASISFYTQDGFVEAAPNVTVHRLSPTVIHLQWRPLPRFLLNGRVHSYQIVEFSATSVDALRELRIPPGSDDPRTAETEDTDFGGITSVNGDQLEHNLTNLVPARAYAVAIAVRNHQHLGPFSDFVIVIAGHTGNSASDGLSSADTAFIVVFVLVPLIIGVILFVAYRRSPRFHRKPLPPLPADALRAVTIRDDSNVIADELLSESFVYNIFRGHMPLTQDSGSVETVPVTVKQLRDPRSDDQLMVLYNEVRALLELQGSPHIVTLLGVHLRSSSAFVCISYTQCSLRHLLRDARPLPRRPALIEHSELFNMLPQIVDGMCFLYDRNVVHRALSTQHIFVHEDGSLRIGTFSAAIIDGKDFIPEHMLAELVSVRWMAPESIADNEFTTASDVFAFGVVLWEIFSYGQKPWAGFSNSEVATNVAKRGTPLDRPQACPHHIYKVMQQCWRMAKTERPLPTTLGDVVEDAIEASVNSDAIAPARASRHASMFAPTDAVSGFGDVDTSDAMGFGIFYPSSGGSKDSLNVKGAEPSLDTRDPLAKPSMAQANGRHPTPPSLTPSSTDSDPAAQEWQHEQEERQPQQREHLHYPQQQNQRQHHHQHQQQPRPVKHVTGTTRSSCV